MTSETDGGSPVGCLLFAILLVLLFGASAFLTGMVWLAGIAVVLCIVFFVVLGGARLFMILYDELLDTWQTSKPTFALLLFLIACAIFSIVIGVTSTF